jgi:hypothetical protein
LAFAQLGIAACILPLHASCPTPKTLTAYSFFDVAAFLQTRMQNARDRRARTARGESPDSIRLFGERGAPAKGGSFASFPYAPNAAVPWRFLNWGIDKRQRLVGIENDDYR